MTLLTINSLRIKRFARQKTLLSASDETGCSLSKFKLDFGLDDKPCPVALKLDDNDPASTDKIVLTSSGKFKYDWCVVSPDPPPQKYRLIVSPTGGLVEKGRPVTINFRLIVYCTTRLFKKLAVVLVPRSSWRKKAPNYDSKPFPYFMINFKLDSELTTSIDFDEVTQDGVALASGGFGTVYKGQWRGLDVAVKKLKVQDLTPEDKETFLKEIKLMKQLACQYVVTLMGFTQIPGQPVCLIMEYVPLGSLTKLLEKQTISEKLKGFIILDIAKGLLFLHNNNIYHRDLKPDNVLVINNFEGANQNVKLTDFDTARAHMRNSSLDDYATYQSLVASTKDVEDSSKKRLSNMGTLIYKAPEVMEGAYKSGNFDIAKTDTFSYGVLTWQVWTQREPFSDPPYSKMSAWEIENFVKSGKRLDIPSNVHIKIRELIAKCWDQKPRKRPDFQNIVKFLQETVPTFESGGSPKTPTSTANNSNHSASSTGDESEPYQLIPHDHYKKIGWYGTINRPEAVKILDSCPIGTFLVRYSSHAKGYVLSYRGQKQVEHIADIKQGADGEISVVKIDGGLRKFPNLLEYVKAMQEQKLITQPIPVNVSQEESIYGRSTFDSSKIDEKKA